MTKTQDIHTNRLQTLDGDQLTVVGGGFLREAGATVGFGAGVAVTGALGFVPKWNAQVPGQPSGFQKRHEAVVGPKVTDYSNGLSTGPWKEFTAGVGAGATVAPGWSYNHGL
jgi:hypothetical protein